MRRFPHLDYPERFPAQRLGAAGLDALLQRGDLDDWAPVASAIRADPYGRLADTILRICASHPMYGTSALWTTWIEVLRGRPATVGLRDLRKARGMTQHDVAERIDSTQSDVSKLEHRTDLRVSTLREYLRALGAELELTAVVDESPAHLRIGGIAEISNRRRR